MLTIPKLSILDERYKETHGNPKFNNQVKIDLLFRLWGTQIFTCLIDFLLVMQTKAEYLLLFETKKILKGIKMNRIL